MKGRIELRSDIFILSTGDFWYWLRSVIERGLLGYTVSISSPYRVLVMEKIFTIMLWCKNASGYDINIVNHNFCLFLTHDDASV